MLPETTVEESGEMSRQVICSVWPLKVRTQDFTRGSQSFRFVSSDPETRYFEDLVKEEQSERWPESLPET
jgi:hypothetical protein